VIPAWVCGFVGSVSGVGVWICCWWCCRRGCVSLIVVLLAWVYGFDGGVASVGVVDGLYCQRGCGWVCILMGLVVDLCCWRGCG
jgi:hypothetical protein